MPDHWMAKNPDDMSDYELIHSLWRFMAEQMPLYDGRHERMWTELERRHKILCDDMDAAAIESRRLQPMTGPQEMHLRYIKRAFCREVDSKYRKGQAEHGGDLFRVQSLRLCNSALEEAIDQVVYLLTLREHLAGDPVRDFLKVDNAE